jgi:hypothetical protein
MRILHSSLFTLLISFCAFAQGTKIEITTCKAYGNEGEAYIFEIGFKVLSGKIEGTGRQEPLALQLSNGTKAFAYINAYDDVAAGKTAPSPATLKVYGQQQVNTGKILVSHDLAPIKIPSSRSFEFKSNMAFLGDEPKVFFGRIKGIKGVVAVGDEIAYTNARGQIGKGKILDLEVEGGYKTNAVFEGVPDDIIQIKVLSSDNIDFSESTVVPANSISTTTSNTTSSTAKTVAHKSKAIPLNVVLENKEVKITVHQLVKFNPDSTDRSLDLFKVDYTFDYYIVDATFENKTTQALDLSEYILRFNFFTSDGKSADDFLRIFNGSKSNNATQKDADKVDTNIFGGSSKLPMASVMVKYETTIPDYDTKHRVQTNALNKPLAAGQKIRSINATIMGVPPSYKIEGLGTWNGTFLDKKKLLFVSIKM